jgi:hypothetical protein
MSVNHENELRLAADAVDRMVALFTTDLQALGDIGSEIRGGLYNAVMKDSPVDTVDTLLSSRADADGLSEDLREALRQNADEMVDRGIRFGYLLGVEMGRRIGGAR